MTLEPFEIDLNVRGETHGYGICRLPRIPVACRTSNAGDLMSTLQNSLGEKESEGELEVMPRGPHGDAHWLFADRDLEWLLDSEQILKSAGRFAINFLYWDSEDASVHRFLE